MSKKVLLLAGITVIIITAGWLIISNRANIPQISPVGQNNTNLKLQPSETFKEYTDPSGFSFSYPDNLSLEKKETEDVNTYADIQLFAKGINGSLNLKISDSKLASIDEWVKMNQNAAQEASKEVMLGNLKAMEVKLKDRLLLGALDQGVLFTIEVPAIEEDFWMKVYNKVLADFSFSPPTQDSASVSDGSADVSFEGEEIVE